jgi:peptidoglycan/LPS O-acetylase OafA/YrhL
MTALSEPASIPSSSSAPVAAPRVHLAALDGIRGLAALYVVLGHANLIYTVETRGMDTPDYGLGRVLAYGTAAVAVFIVLSGYCLMTPLALAGSQKLIGGTGKYFLRRARRILPPYYMAMAITLAGICFLPALAEKGTRFWGLVFPAFSADVIATHVLMVFNLNDAWIHKINPPFWSVATEWQIYFLFPMVFLPLSRRLGMGAMIVAAFVIGLLPHFALARGGWPISEAHPWYTGLFAMGVLAAVASLGQKPEFLARLLKRCALPVMLAGLALVVGLDVFTAWRDKRYLPYDLAYGVATMGMLVLLTRGCADATADFQIARACRRALDFWPIKHLGDMSYSLYLIHCPMLVLVHRLTAPWHTSPARVIAIMFGLAVPLTLGVTVVFHVLFERPFMTTLTAKKTPPRVAHLRIPPETKDIP